MKEQEEEKKSKNANLHKAKEEKNDEFYTQYADIESEVNAYLDYNENVFRGKTVLCPCNDGPDSNFTKLFCDMFGIWGLKKLICVSYDKNGHGKAGILDHDPGRNGQEQMVWSALSGTGDFRSGEVTQFLNEADFVITNPPFSLFREFMAWIKKAGKKKFLVIGNMNAITYKEIFPDIMNNLMWLGTRLTGMDFMVPENFQHKNIFEDNGVRLFPLGNVLWFTNIDHGIRHEPLFFNTMARNIKYGTCKELKEWKKYPKYDNYDAIEVPKMICIPSDYPGVMGVPISFLGSYCPEQFEILGATESEGLGFSHGLWDKTSSDPHALINGNSVYKRIFIKHKNPQEKK